MTDHDLHRYLGNRKLDNYESVMEVCKNGKLVTMGEIPRSIGDFVNAKRKRRGKRSSKPARGHTICIDIGYGCGTSPGGHRYCLFVVDKATTQCWVYGLRDLSGSTLVNAF